MTRTTATGTGGAITAPHGLAAAAGLEILERGGSAIEAMIAAAATIAVTYPHMNGIGGDGFWLISRPDGRVVGIEACGRAAALATPDRYRHGGRDAIPARGAEAALTVPGTVGGWALARSLVDEADRLPLDVLLGAAAGHAEAGFPVSPSQSKYTALKRAELEPVPGFADVFLPGGTVPEPGSRFGQPRLAATLRTLIGEGLEAFYRGPLAATHAEFLEAAGSPLRPADFAAAEARIVSPLSVRLGSGTVYNLPPPTQGFASLLILAIFERISAGAADGFDHLHRMVEATKQAFIHRNRHLGDPDAMTRDGRSFLDAATIEAAVAAIDPHEAAPWPHPAAAGDTIWMGAADRSGTLVSFIQSIYWEFGSGVVCPGTGVLFQNRGAGFSLEEGPNQLAPGRRPFHTLNPALAHLGDGRRLSYGTMGGEGQPQTQAAIFSRYVQYGQDLAAAVAAPRWLLGRTWGDSSTTLKLENRFAPELGAALAEAGHRIEWIEAYSDLAGHAGAVVRHEDGRLEAAADPRSDGAALAV